MRLSLLSMILMLNLFVQAQNTIGTLLNTPASMNGYTLIAPSNAKKVFLVDNCGFIVNEWESDYAAGLCTYLLPEGNLLRSGVLPENGFQAGGSGGIVELFNWEGELTWSYQFSSEFCHQHHDLEYLPNGNILILAWDLITPIQATDNGRDPMLLSPNGLWSEKIIEVKPVGTNEVEIVWEWNLWDHIIQEFDQTRLNYGSVVDNPHKLNLNYVNDPLPIVSNFRDWIHANSIDYNPDLDQIIINALNMGEFWIIDHSTTTEEAATSSGGKYNRGGDFLYRWGNPFAYGRGEELDRQIFGQHDVHWVPEGIDGAGQIQIFNNGLARPGDDYSSIERLISPILEDGSYDLKPDQAYGPDSVAHIINDNNKLDFFAKRVSGSQSLENGNVLVCIGDVGRILEISPEEEIVFEYIIPLNNGNPLTQGMDPFGNFTFRAYRYFENGPELVGLSLEPGSRIELESMDNTCDIFELSSIDNISKTNLVLYPNPTTERVFIQSNYEQVQFRLFNHIGQLLESSVYTEKGINMSHLDPGLYVLKIGQNSEQISEFIIKL